MIPATHQLTWTGHAPLYFQPERPSRRRVYRHNELDDAPSRAVEKACQTLAEGFEPSWATECAVESFRGTHAEHGLFIDDSNGPWWSVGCQGEGVGLTATIEDFALYLDWRNCPKHTKRRLLWLERQGDVDMRFEPRSGHYPRTVANVTESHYGGRGQPGDDGLTEAIEWLESDAEDAARDLAHEMLGWIRADYEYHSSREHLENELRNLDQGLTEDGELVELSDCCGEE